MRSHSKESTGPFSRTHSAKKNYASVAKKTNLRLLLQFEIIILLAGLEFSDYEIWSKFGAEVCSKPLKSVKASKKSLTPECDSLSTNSVRSSSDGWRPRLRGCNTVEGGNFQKPKIGFYSEINWLFVKIN